MIYCRKSKSILGILTIIFAFNVYLMFMSPATNVKEVDNEYGKIIINPLVESFK